MPRNIHSGTAMTHAEECRFLNDLIIDLKKKDLGHDHTPITMERLEMASKCMSTLQQCRVKMLYR
jgi:hypothetical protein